MGKNQKDSVLLAVGVLSVSSKFGNKRTYVWGKGKRTRVLLGVGEQESEIQNAQINFIIVRRQKKKSDL